MTKFSLGYVLWDEILLAHGLLPTTLNAILCKWKPVFLCCFFFFCGGGGFFFFTSAPLIAFAILEKYHGVEIFHTIYLATGPGYLLKLRKWSYTFNGHHLIQLENVILRLENSGVFSFEVRKGVPWCTLCSESYWERYKHARLSLERLYTLRHPTGNKRHFSLCNSFPVCVTALHLLTSQSWRPDTGRTGEFFWSPSHFLNCCVLGTGERDEMVELPMAKG